MYLVLLAIIFQQQGRLIMPITTRPKPKDTKPKPVTQPKPKN